MNQIKQMTRREATFRTAPIVMRDLRGSMSTGRTIVGLLPYNSRSVDMGFVEIITPGAFQKTLREGADVKALFAHDAARPLGRVKNGTLKLRDTPQGLECTAILPKTIYADDLLALIREDYVTTMSFGFNNAKTREEYENGRAVTYLLEVDLIEVSFGVVFPAYLETDSEVRKGGDAFIRYLSTLSTAEIVKLHRAAVKQEGDPETMEFLKELNAAAQKMNLESRGIKTWDPPLQSIHTGGNE